MHKGKAVEVIADELEEDIEEIRSICVTAEAFAPDYDEEQVELNISDKCHNEEIEDWNR